MVCLFFRVREKQSSSSNSHEMPCVNFCCNILVKFWHFNSSLHSYAYSSENTNYLSENVFITGQSQKLEKKSHAVTTPPLNAVLICSEFTSLKKGNFTLCSFIKVFIPCWPLCSALPSSHPWEEHGHPMQPIVCHEETSHHWRSAHKAAFGLGLDQSSFISSAASGPGSSEAHNQQRGSLAVSMHCELENLVLPQR